ncbi:hypothetical protein Purlil1_13472 [Purpureocillium lilacinum]|uniref:Uncharacterized protein n=1 Tax=Purpureocillium lilacinum TaxID=33203 RepID=A0ABR0BE42_PURLI|nr:hypothetical protein Purlil1_13472 [Purpureocillium lilacinum]
MTSNEPNMCPRMSLPSSHPLETVPSGRPGSSDRLSHALFHEDVHRSSAALPSARVDANEIRHLPASPPVDVFVPADVGAGTYTTLNGGHSPSTQSNAGDGSAQSYGPITLLSDIPASDISSEYLGSLLTHDPARIMSGDTATSHTQRQPPAGLCLNGHASIGGFPNLARSTSVDTSCSDDQVHSPAEVSLNAYESRVVETLDSELQHELDELLARIDAFVAGDPNAPMLEEQPSALPIHGRQRSLGAPHGAQDMAAAARLLQLRAVEVPNRESSASEQQTSREQAEEFGEDLEDSTELWQVTFDKLGQKIDHNNLLDQILAD